MLYMTNQQFPPTTWDKTAIFLSSKFMDSPNRADAKFATVGNAMLRMVFMTRKVPPPMIFHKMAMFSHCHFPKSPDPRSVQQVAVCFFFVGFFTTAAAPLLLELVKSPTK